MCWTVVHGPRSSACTPRRLDWAGDTSGYYTPNRLYKAPERLYKAPERLYKDPDILDKDLTDLTRLTTNINLTSSIK